MSLIAQIITLNILCIKKITRDEEDEKEEEGKRVRRGKKKWREGRRRRGRRRIIIIIGAESPKECRRWHKKRENSKDSSNS